MFRRYTISIEASDDLPFQPGAVEAEIGCSISEPSNWLGYGATDQRGLTFLDTEGRELTSPIFQHQPLFQPPNEGTDEATEIRNFIFHLLSQNFAITPANLKIKVTEYNRV